MFQGKKKAVTFSYDDGITQDIKFIELLNKYALKGTFNINSAYLGIGDSFEKDGKIISYEKVNPRDIKSIYEGHEIAAHTLTHPDLTKIKDDDTIIYQVEEDRKRLSELAGYEVVGMAYPGGNVDRRVKDIIKNKTGIKYARTVEQTFNFKLQKDLYAFNPTIHHHGNWDRLFELGREFIELDAKKESIFYIWGHTCEFDYKPEYWDKLEEFFKLISGKKDIFYGTNKEILL